MKVEVESKFVKPKVDVQDGDLITFLNEGEEREGQYGKKLNISVRTEAGKEKLLSLNNVSKKNLIEHYGDDTLKWIGKQARVNITTQNVNGDWVDVINLTAPNKDLKGNVIIE